MKTWEELDVAIASDMASMNARNGMLNAQILVLLAKNVIGTHTPVDVIRLRLRRKYDISYALEDVATETTILQHEDEVRDTHVLITEDHFQGA